MSLAIVGCSSHTAYAPVVENSLRSGSEAGYYRVKTGDTLYSIAWGYGLDYRKLAKANKLQPPYRIRSGQKLRMKINLREEGPPSMVIATKKDRKKNVKKPAKKLVYFAQWGAERKSSNAVPQWAWPARGQILDHFDRRLGGNKGINIAGRYGEPVKVSAKGIVVYSGDGVRGYGNLVIVKHSDSYLSAYAFNKRILVKEGMRVREGQVIAEMGRDGTGKVMLHFEIRRNGKPVNPLNYLS